MRKSLSQWIRRFHNIFGGKQQQPSSNSTITELPDDYLFPALQIAASLADQICEAVEEGGQSPMPGSDWIDSIVVITDGSSPLSSGERAAGCDVSNNTRVEILPSSLLFNTADSNNSSGQAARANGVLYSLGIVFYELFSGVRPTELERPDESQGQTRTEEMLESLDPLPFDHGNIDLEAFTGVGIHGGELLEFNDLQDEYHEYQDEYNEIWGNNNTDCFRQGQNPRKEESRNNDNIMYSVSVEPLKARGVPGPLCELIANMLDIVDGRLGEDGYRDISD
eukprot:scaffold20383_cov82-Skeletonema_marinoi.AAC.1